MNSFGNIFKVSIFGESHGENIGIVIDGCPPGIEIDLNEMQHYLDRRKSGSKGTTPRTESDIPKIVSGCFENKTTGAPICILFNNENTKSKDYSNLVTHPRPGHADFTAKEKFKGFNDYRGGGHFSARVTVALTAAGWIAKRILSGIEIDAVLVEAGGNKNIEEAVNQAIESNDSIGGIIECTVKGFPVGVGEPFFDSIESVISHAVFSIPAVKGIEFGVGFRSAALYGSQMNDNIIDSNGLTETNNSGGINGGLSNGNNIYFRTAFRGAPSISKKQNTWNFNNNKKEDLLIKGRHDACIVLRAPVIVESACAIALADLLLRNETY